MTYEQMSDVLIESDMDEIGQQTELLSPNEETEEQIHARYGNNPHFKNMFQRLLQNTVQMEEAQPQPGTSKGRDDGDDVRAVEYRQRNIPDETPKRKRQKLTTETTTSGNFKQTQGMNVINSDENANKFNSPSGCQHGNNETPVIGNVNKVKSPSDTTIYVPGLQQLNLNESYQNQHMLDKISNFVESVRHEVMEPSQPI